MLKIDSKYSNKFHHTHTKRFLYLQMNIRKWIIIHNVRLSNMNITFAFDFTEKSFAYFQETRCTRKHAESYTTEIEISKRSLQW